MNNPLTQVVFIQRALLFMNQNNLKEEQQSPAPVKGRLPDDPQQLVRDSLRLHQLPLLYVTSSWTECIEEFETFALWWRNKILYLGENENDNKIKIKIPFSCSTRKDTFRVLFYILCRLGNPWLLKQVIEMIPKLVSSSSRNKPQLRTMSKFPDSSSSSEDEDENTTSSSSLSPLLVSHLSRVERKAISRYLSEFRFEKLDMMRVDGTFSFFFSRQKLDDEEEIEEENTSTASHVDRLLTSSDKPTSLAQVLYSFNKQRANNVSTDAQVRDRALPLHVCAMHGNTDCCRVLIEFAKVDIDHVSNASKSSLDASKTALWYAVKYRHVETVKYLFCEAGALLLPDTRAQQVYVKDSPLFVLFNDDDDHDDDIEKSQEEKRKKQEILDIILEPSLWLVECFSKVTAFYAAAVKCLPELLEAMFHVAEKSQELKEQIVNPRLTFGYSQSTPLHACINGGLPESKVLPTLRLLLTKLGCSSDDMKAFIRTSVDSTGDTVAHAVAKRGYALCLNMIFDEFYPELCYDFLTRDEVTTSAPPLLHCAAINGHYEVCQLLAKKCPELLFLERKLAITDEKGTTPREWANRSRHTGKKVGALLAQLEREYRAEYMKKAEALERRNDFASSSSDDDDDDDYDE